MLVKILVIGLLIAMIISLFSGLFHLVKQPDKKDQGDKVVNALTWRIGIWVVLFIFIALSLKLGWIEPSNSVNPENFYKGKTTQQ